MVTIIVIIVLAIVKKCQIYKSVKSTKNVTRVILLCFKPKPKPNPMVTKKGGKNPHSITLLNGLTKNHDVTAQGKY